MYKKITYHNQVRFITGMGGWLNIWKLLNGIHYIHRLNKKNHLIILIYVEKASDKIQHPFMQKLN